MKLFNEAKVYDRQFRTAIEKLRAAARKRSRRIYVQVQRETSFRVSADISLGAASFQAEEPADAPPLSFSTAYVDHAMNLLDPENTDLGEDGRRRVVDELLRRMVQDDSLSEDKFVQVIPEVQSRAPEAFGALAARMLREGHLSTGAEQRRGYFMLRRLGATYPNRSLVRRSRAGVSPRPSGASPA